jgi:hypothetical protein
MYMYIYRYIETMMGMICAQILPITVSVSFALSLSIYIDAMMVQMFLNLC